MRQIKGHQKRILLFNLVVALAFLSTSCLKDKTIPLGPCVTVVSYSTDIRPIIENSCKTQAGPGTGCHDAWIDDYSQITGQIAGGGWSNRVISLKDMPVMPNTWGIDSLSSDEIQVMQCWIDQGYPEN
ncbi:MAG: hypothetical protein ACI857_003011 [Arenicella sp.]